MKVEQLAKIRRHLRLLSPAHAQIWGHDYAILKSRRFDETFVNQSVTNDAVFLAENVGRFDGIFANKKCYDLTRIECELFHEIFCPRGHEKAPCCLAHGAPVCEDLAKSKRFHEIFCPERSSFSGFTNYFAKEKPVTGRRNSEIISHFPRLCFLFLCVQ